MMRSILSVRLAVMAILLGLAQSAATAKEAFDVGRERAALLSPSLKQSFPRLGERFVVLGPSTPDYNCIAHSLGLHDRWVNPMTGARSHPPGLMDELYAAQGY